VDDDLHPTTEEETRKPTQAAARTAMQAPSAAPAGKTANVEAVLAGSGPQAAERSAYFGGRYAPVGKAVEGAGQKNMDAKFHSRFAEFDVPETLRHRVWVLIHILRDHGRGAAAAALRDDPAIDRNHAARIGKLLAAIDKDTRHEVG